MTRKELQKKRKKMAGKEGPKKGTDSSGRDQQTDKIPELGFWY